MDGNLPTPLPIQIVGIVGILVSSVLLVTQYNNGDPDGFSGNATGLSLSPSLTITKNVTDHLPNDEESKFRISNLLKQARVSK